jgi:hypothetical protein
VRVADAGPAQVAGDEAADDGPARMGEPRLPLTSGNGEEERMTEVEEAGAGEGAGGLKAGGCDLGADARAKKPETAWRALEREREIFSKTREGSRGGLLGRADAAALRPDS